MNLAVKGVYRILNTKTGDVYIGASTNIAQRWAGHRSALLRNSHENAALQATWTEHGADAFVVEVLERVTAPTDLGARERAYIDAAGEQSYNRQQQQRICAWCSTPFVDERRGGGRPEAYCSDACLHAAEKRQAAARMRKMRAHLPPAARGRGRPKGS